MNNLARVKWACRRGMLELDVLLNKFLASGYAQLTEKEQQSFQLLLSQSDPELFDWLLGHHAPKDESFKNIVKIIRDYVQS